MRIKDLKQNDTVRCFGATGSYLATVQKVVTDMTNYRDVAYVIKSDGMQGTLTDNDEWLFYDYKVSNKKQYSSDVQQKKRFEHLEDILDGKKATNERPEDIVNQPSHYTYGKIEIIEIVEQVTATYPTNIAFSIGNALKYICRAPFKNGVEDLKKAVWYLNRCIEKWEEK
ncbi:DUF3310 domain-containing protein [Staphylococcus aureus]